MTIGYRIKKARLTASFSQGKLANAISNFGDGKRLSRTAIAQWESGATKEIGAANLLKAAKILSVNPEWLQFGTGEIKPAALAQSGLFPTDLEVRTLPILSFLEALNYMEFNKSNVSYTGIDQDLAAVAGPDVFALVVKDASMMPELKPGDIVVIDPAIAPQPGETVLAKLDNEDPVFLRRYRLLGKDAKGLNTFELIPINEYWPKIIVNSDNPGHIIGTLVEHRCRRRLNSPEQESDSATVAVEKTTEDE